MWQSLLQAHYHETYIHVDTFPLPKPSPAMQFVSACYDAHNILYKRIEHQLHTKKYHWIIHSIIESSIPCTSEHPCHPSMHSTNVPYGNRYSLKALMKQFRDHARSETLLMCGDLLCVRYYNVRHEYRTDKCMIRMVYTWHMKHMCTWYMIHDTQSTLCRKDCISECVPWRTSAMTYLCAICAHMLWRTFMHYARHVCSMWVHA